jgi:hypothetical protein
MKTRNTRERESEEVAEPCTLSFVLHTYEYIDYMSVD